MGLGHKMRQHWCVIVADDDSDWRTLVALSLRRRGYIVVEAADGEELVTLCRSLDASEGYQLIIVSDVDMPGRTGIEAVVLLRAMNILAPVLLVTGALGSQVVDAATSAGAREIVGKPISGDRIGALVDCIRAEPA